MRRRMSTKIQEQYGLLPKLGFEEGIKETYTYYEKNR
jgi:dTDP-D-glucose 4,6-dehydratase